MADYDHLQRYVEKEKTRELIIEAVQGGTVTDFWRNVLLGIFFFGAIGGVWAFQTERLNYVLDALNRDPPSARHKVSRKKVAQAPEDPDKLVANADKAWEKEDPAVAASSAKFDENSGDEGIAGELRSSQKSREALGKQLEAVGEGRGLPPPASAVIAAMNGKEIPVAPAASSPAPASAPAQGTGAPASQSAVTGTPPSSAPNIPSTAPTAAQQAGLPQRAPASAHPGETGISNGEKETTTMMELIVKPGAPVYRQLKQLPAHYAKDKPEFPDFP